MAKPLAALCEELGSNTHFTQRIIVAGIRTVSANPKQIFAVPRAEQKTLLNG